MDRGRVLYAVTMPESIYGDDLAISGQATRLCYHGLQTWVVISRWIDD